MAKSRFSHRPLRALCILITKLLLLPCLAVIIVFSSGATASTEAVRWTRVNIPTGGEAGNRVLAAGSDVRHLTMAPDGSLYACCQGLTYTLYKSTDGGFSWAHTGNVQDTVVDIAVSPYDADTLYYATTSAVYRSTNGGRTFVQLSAGPGRAGTDQIEITSIDVAWLNGNIIALGTRDTDISEFGGVYILDEADIIPAWADTSVGNYDVYAVAFSPNYASDRQLTAVITDETNTFTTSKTGDLDWGAITGNARLDRDNSGTAVVIATPAAIAYPGNYHPEASSGSCVYFVAIDTGAGEGDVYKINCADAPGASTAIDLNVGQTYGMDNIDITGVTARGDYPSLILLAGAADSTQTYVSTDGGASWTRSRKEPTGDSRTYVLIPPDFTTTGMMYAATGGGDSALSVSRDIGDTWNQVSLIDTAIDTIVDLAPSPHYIQDNTLFMLTFGGGRHSLWRSRDGGDIWERTLARNLEGVDSLNCVALPPQYGVDCRKVFVAGESNGIPTVWYSTDDGQNYRRQSTRDPVTGDAFPVDTWAIAGETAIFIGSYDGTHGMVYQTTNSGFFYAEGVPAGSQSLNSLVLSPAYKRDGTILAGNTNGWVYLSSDNGTLFEPMPGDATSPPFTGSITVAFDPEFENNRTVYAASDTADSGVYRFVIGTDTDWESIDGTLPAGAMLSGLAVIHDGTLYAANSDDDGGMERCLNPTYAFGPSFETVIRGLEDSTTLTGLWWSDHRIWSVDTTNTRLMTFYDTLISPVTQTYPGNGASGIGSLIDHTVRNISLDWDTLEGATSYEWQCDYDTDFSSVPAGFEDSTTASSAHLPALDPATTYYWRVRTSAPVVSPWSEKWSFTTSLGTEAIVLKPESPAAGAGGVPVKPLFQWTAVIGAEAYELLVATDADFIDPSIVRTDEYALPANAWQCDVSLDYGTTYYWKVRATSASTRSTWSAAGVFTTESLPEAAETPTEPPIIIPPQPQEMIPEITPSLTTAPLPTTSPAVQVNPPTATVPSQDSIYLPPLSQLPDVPGWMIYMFGGLLMTIILALIIILAIVLKMRRF